MPFTIVTSVKRVTSYPEYGASCDPIVEQESVTFTASRVTGLDAAGAAQVVFDVSIDGTATSGSYYHSFTYSGTGSPIEEAEKSLKEALT